MTKEKQKEKESNPAKAALLSACHEKETPQIPSAIAQEEQTAPVDRVAARKVANPRSSDVTEGQEPTPAGVDAAVATASAVQAVADDTVQVAIAEAASTIDALQTVEDSVCPDPAPLGEQAVNAIVTPTVHPDHEPPVAMSACTEAVKAKAASDSGADAGDGAETKAKDASSSTRPPKPETNPKKILMVGSEVMPFAATGGLGDVLGSLPLALKAKYGDEVDVRVLCPLYDKIGPQWREQMKTEAIFTVPLAWRNQYCGVLSLVKNGVTFYFMDNEYYFSRGSLYGHFDDGERFAFFCRAVPEVMDHLGFYPDILHAHDWQAALSIVYLNLYYRHRPEYASMRTVMTIHNIEYQGKYNFAILGDVFAIDAEHCALMGYDGCINLMKAAIQCADRVTTVSPTYANEIRTEAYAHGLHHTLNQNGAKLCGILNGIDTGYYNPAADPDLPFPYSAESPEGKRENKRAFQKAYALPESPDAPMLAVVSRLATHKGVHLIMDMIRPLLNERPDVQFVLLGTGEATYEAFFRQLEHDYPQRVRSFIMYDRALSKKIYAAADLLLMPSLSEPCGLSQMIAARYGTLPIVRETGGLYDSIQPYYENEEGMHGNGFTFAHASEQELADRVRAALWLLSQPEKRAALMRRAMTTDFSWDASAGRYMDLYRSLS